MKWERYVIRTGCFLFLVCTKMYFVDQCIGIVLFRVYLVIDSVVEIWWLLIFNVDDYKNIIDLNEEVTVDTSYL